MPAIIPNPKSRSGSNAAPLAMLLLGNLVFFGCIVSKTGGTAAAWEPAAAAGPVRLALLGD